MACIHNLLILMAEKYSIVWIHHSCLLDIQLVSTYTHIYKYINKQFVYPFTHFGVVSIFCLSRIGDSIEIECRLVFCQEPGGRGGMHTGYSVSFWGDDDI